MSIDIGQVPRDPAFCYRDGLDVWPGGAALTASVARRGVLVPLAVSGFDDMSPHGVLVSGFRRLEAAERAGVQRLPVARREGPAVEA